jgi:hypothetical protein
MRGVFHYLSVGGYMSLSCGHIRNFLGAKMRTGRAADNSAVPVVLTVKIRAEGQNSIQFLSLQELLGKPLPLLRSTQ